MMSHTQEQIVNSNFEIAHTHPQLTTSIAFREEPVFLSLIGTYPRASDDS